MNKAISRALRASIEGLDVKCRDTAGYADMYTAGYADMYTAGYADMYTAGYADTGY